MAGGELNSSETPPLPAGEILGAADALGHRLQAMNFPEPTETLKTPVVIVGGGIAGLSAGWKLLKAGFTDFVILELESEVGGNARSGAEHDHRLSLGRALPALPHP